MNRKVVTSKVGGDGTLRIEVALGPEAADEDVQVTIEPAPPKQMSQDEWRRFIMETAGSIPDPSFRRWEQGQYEQRDPL